MDGFPQRIARLPTRSALAALVLIVELLRQLVERQAIRRLGTVTSPTIRWSGRRRPLALGSGWQLREHLGLRPEDLNLDLGPLGPLLPRD